MIHRVLTTEQLLEATGYDRPADLCRSLEQQGVKFLRGKGGKPWTTVDLINAAMGLVPKAESAGEAPLSPEEF